MKQTRFLMLVVLLGLVACKKDPADPGPAPVVPPQQQLPNPLPATALVDQLKWTDNDHETMTYNNQGQVAQLISQWQYVEGDPTKIRSIQYDFHYDTEHKPVMLSYSDGFRVQYIYHDTLVERTREMLSSGTMLNEVTYLYNTDLRIVQEVHRRTDLGEPVRLYKFVFGYDTKGNLNKIDEYEQTGVDQFNLLHTTEYSDFDNKMNPTSWMLRFPFLPQVRWQMNNPGREVHRWPSGESRTTLHSYEYNAAGLPKLRRTTAHTGDVYVMNYSY